MNTSERIMRSEAQKRAVKQEELLLKAADLVQEQKDWNKRHKGTLIAERYFEDMLVDQHAPGAKLDQGKPRTGLVLGAFSRALTEVAQVGTFGAEKYSDNGWLEVENGEQRYRDALFRHLLAPDDTDPESGLSHLAHAAWNVLAILELEIRREDG